MKYLTVFILSLLFFAACQEDPVSERDTTKEIRGYVTERISGKVLDSAEVRIQGTKYVTYSDSIGFYSFKDIDYDRYRIIAQKEPYKTVDSLVEYYGGGIKTLNFKLEKSRLIALTDSSSYTLGLVRYSLFNNTDFSAWFDHCCRRLIYALVKETNGDWYFSDWKNLECDQYCDKTPIELMPDSTRSESLILTESGTYKIAVLHGYNPKYTNTDTTFSNVFTVMIK